MNIRFAKLEDSAGIAHVQVDSYRSAYAGILPQVYLDNFTYAEEEQDWRRLLSGQGREILLVAESVTDEIAGYALGRPEQHEIASFASELEALHVRQPYQRQGIGRQLVKAMAAQLQQQGCPSLLLWVLKENSARQFYEKLGGEWICERTLHLQEEVTALEVAYGWPDITSLFA